MLALPLVLLPYALLLLGLAWLVSALGVFLRDLAQLVGPLVMVCMFLGPVFYPREAMPAAAQQWLALNPITVPVEQVRRVLFDAQWPQWDVVAQYSLVAAGRVCCSGCGRSPDSRKDSPMSSEAARAAPRDRLLGELLLDAGLLGVADLERGLALQQKIGGRLGSVLMRIGAVSEDNLLQVLSRQLGLPVMGADVPPRTRTRCG
jgi:hypothetical protein